MDKKIKMYEKVLTALIVGPNKTIELELVAVRPVTTA